MALSGIQESEDGKKKGRWTKSWILMKIAEGSRPLGCWIDGGTQIPAGSFLFLSLSSAMALDVLLVLTEHTIW